MLDISSIEAVDVVDGEEVFAFGRDLESGQRHWAWISIEALSEAGREDVIEQAHPAPIAA